jgi:hypothetical protein
MNYDIAMFPQNCSPLNGTTKTPGWAQCSSDCSNCMDCDPNMKTDCGQMVAASGIGCVPSGCFDQCCNAQTNSKPVKVKAKYESQQAFYKKPVFIASSVSIVVILILLLVIFGLRR